MNLLRSVSHACFVVGTGDYSRSANLAFFLFGILVLAMVIGRILWSKIS